MSKHTRDTIRVTRDAKKQVALLAVAFFAGSLCQADGLVDPTRPPGADRKSNTVQPIDATPRVTAILESGERRVAVFLGQVVKAGDRIGDVFIEAVVADGVRYRRGGRVEFARLPKQAASVRHTVDSEENEP